MADHPHAGHRDRVKKRYIASGLDGFAPHELVEMLLFFGIPQRDTNPLAHRLIDTFGNVSSVLRADRAMLMRVEGMTQNAATLLTLVGDLQLYCAKEARPLGMILHSTEDIVDFLMPHFAGLSSEEVWMLSMDTLSRVLAVHCVSRGSPVLSEINVREVLRFALADNAMKIVLAHNHPSGIALPSDQDITTTAALAKALEGAGIRFADHLIYARDSDCISFRSTRQLLPALQGIPVTL